MGARRNAPGDAASFEQFLVDHGAMSSLLLPAFRAAMRHSETSAVSLAFNEGIVGENALFRALARFQGLPYLERDEGWQVEVEPIEVESCLRHLWVRLRDRSGRTFVVAAPRDPWARLLRHLEVPGAVGHRGIDAIAAPSTIRAIIDRAFSARFTEKAVWDLARNAPEFSAHRRMAPWQAAALAALAVGAVAGAFVAPLGTYLALAVLLGLVFLSVTLVRLFCLGAAFAGRRARPQITPSGGPADRDLPLYTILVPLYREAGIVHQTVAALLALDYPRSRLDIKLVLEEDDAETQGAVRILDLPGCIEVVIVPPSFPRTKPKAMNYALSRARGSLIAIFDAEDLPQPDQLRRAAAAFAAAPDDVACFQARLGFYNWNQNWLTRQFAVEYASLFEVILPALDRLSLPLMLGGTSNHFRVSALLEAGGWDAYNVTEDADLGMRLSRLDYKCAWLDSLTLEEAASGPRNWYGQRVRWLRGWIQTYFVHMQHPLRLLGDMGLWRFIAFQGLVGGLVVSAMVYPLFLGHFAWSAIDGSLFVPFADAPFNGILAVNALNLIFGFSTAFEIAVVGLYRLGQPRLLLQLPFLPLYWLLVSLASYVAAWRFFRRPFEWEKTRHHPRRSSA